MMLADVFLRHKRGKEDLGRAAALPELALAGGGGTRKLSGVVLRLSA